MLETTRYMVYTVKDGFRFLYEQFNDDEDAIQFAMELSEIHGNVQVDKESVERIWNSKD